MTTNKTYKYITIKQIDREMWENKPVYRIVNNKSKALLGMLSYYSPWKQYVFSSRENCVFNIDCLHDVMDFIENVISIMKPPKVKIPENTVLAGQILESFRDDSQFPNINEVVFKKDDCLGAMIQYGNEIQIKP